MNTRILALLLAAQCLLAGCSTTDNMQADPDEINGQDLVFDHNGVQRTYKIYRPEGMPDNAPLLLALHGLGGTSSGAYRSQGFNELAEKHGFLAVYPQSLRKTVTLDREDAKAAGLDLDGLCKSGKPTDDWMKFVCVDGKLVSTAGNVRWNDTGSDGGEDDVEFLSELVGFLQDRYQLNPEKTFVTGMSNGAYMSYTLLCRAGDVFKGAAPVAGLSEYSVLNSCDPQGPKALLHIHGVDDQLVPISGNPGNRKKGGKEASFPSPEEMAEYFAGLSNYAKKETLKVSRNATLYKYLPEGDGFEVHYYRIENYGHDWPGSIGKDGKRRNGGAGFIASEVIWDFFSRY